MSEIIQPYPHYEITLTDKTNRSVYQQRTLPLFRPLIYLPTQKGVPGEPTWNDDLAVAKSRYGSETFNKSNKKYYSPASILLEKVLKSGAFIARAVDSKANNACGLVALAITAGKNLDEYEIDELSGNFKQELSDPADPDSDLIYVETGDTIVGCEVRYKYITAWAEILQLVLGITALQAAEEQYQGSAGYIKVIERLKTNPFTASITINTETLIPVCFVGAKTPGEYGNDVGFSIGFNRSQNLTKFVNNRSGFIFEFAPFRKTYGTNNTTTIKTRYGSDAVNFAFTEQSLDTQTQIDYTRDYVMEMSYPEATHEVDMDIHLLFNNIKYISAIMAYFDSSIEAPSTALLGLDGSNKLIKTVTDTAEIEAILENYNAGLFNIFGLRDPDGQVYQAIRMPEAAVTAPFFLPGTRKYLANGSDGDVFKRDVFETLFTEFFSLNINVNLTDSARYPFNAIFDCGYTLKNKFDIFDFMAHKRDFFCEVGVTMDPFYTGTNKVATPLEDLSVAAVLRNRALLTKECVIKGTGTCRANIYVTSGYIKGYNNPLGLQFWIADKLATYDNGTFLDKVIAGLPNAEVDMFTKMVWVPSTDDLKSLTWDHGVNYAQYFDIDRYHVASRRTVYTNDISLLSDADMAKTLVYTYHEVRSVWAMFSGVKLPKNVLWDKLEREVIKRLTTMYNNNYEFKVKAYQTETDAQMGFVTRVQIEILSGSAFRVAIFEIIVNDDYSQE